MEHVKNHQKTTSLAKKLILPLIIVLSIAVLNFILTMSTPEISFTAGSWFGLRPSHVLKSLAFATPFAGAGISLGDYYISFYTGKIVTGIHWLLPLINLTVCAVIYKLSKIGTQEGIKYHAKNIAMLIVYAIIITVAVRINHAILKFPETVFMATKFQGFFWAGMAGRLISSICATLFGYPLFLTWVKGSKMLKSKFGE